MPSPKNRAATCIYREGEGSEGKMQHTPHARKKFFLIGGAVEAVEVVLKKLFSLV
jgi:hypothetical protein